MPKRALEIIVTATDKGAAVFKELQKDLKSTKKESQSFRDMMKGLGNALPVLGVTSFGAAITMTAGFLKGAADETLGYANQVRELNRTIGASPEEASKLIQAADDVGIEFDKLQLALEGAIKKGVKPTIAGIGLLSDEYLRLAPGVERTAFLFDKFGRSGADVARLMELGSAKIQEMGDSVEGTGLLMTQQGLDAAEKYRVAMDNLGDSATGLKMKIGMGVIPVLTEFIDVLNGQQKTKPVFTTSAEAIKRFREEAARARTEQEKWTRITEFYTVKTEEATKATDNFAFAVKTYATMQDLANATRMVFVDDGPEFNAELEVATQMALMGAQAVTEFGSAIQGAAIKAQPAGEQIRDALDFHDLDMGLAAAISAEVGKALTFVKTGGKWAELQQDFKNVLELKNIDVKAQAAVLGILEVQALQMEKDLGLITFVDFKQSIADLGGQFGKTTQDAYVLISYLKNLVGYDGKSVDVNVILNWMQQGRFQYRPPKPEEYAQGGDFIVPAGFPNDTYPINVTSGERVIVIPPGQKMAGAEAGGGSQVVITNIYNTLNLSSSARSERVADDFALASAWSR